MDLSIILPCYNEEENLPATVRDVSLWVKTLNFPCTIIAVNDGSSDSTASVLLELQKHVPELTIVTHEKNQGYGVAVRSGCDAATTEWMVFMDSDGQFHAKDIALLLAHKDAYPFITGRRAKRADSFVRNMFGKILGAMNVLVLGLWVRDVNCGMKLFRKDIWKDIRPTYGVEKLFNTEMFLRLKYNHIPWRQVNVPHYPRTAGTQTGGSIRVIKRMFEELFALKRAFRSGASSASNA